MTITAAGTTLTTSGGTTGVKASGSGYGVYGTSSTGVPGFFQITNTANSTNALTAQTNGSGDSFLFLDERRGFGGARKYDRHGQGGRFHHQQCVQQLPRPVYFDWRNRGSRRFHGQQCLQRDQCPYRADQWFRGLFLFLDERFGFGDLGKYDRHRQGRRFHHQQCVQQLPCPVCFDWRDWGSRVFNTYGGGKILSGQNNGTEKFSVDAGGNVTATSFTGSGGSLDPSLYYTKAEVAAIVQALQVEISAVIAQYGSLPNGGNCASDRQCVSGNCVDGVCCDQKCAGNCQSCTLSGKVGVCTPVPDGQDPRLRCQGSSGGRPCAQERVCRGSACSRT